MTSSSAYVSLIVLASLLLASCEEVLDYDTLVAGDQSQRLVVEGFVTDRVGESYVQLWVTRPIEAAEQDPAAATNATVAIGDGDSTWVWQEDPATPGRFLPHHRWIGQTGKTYSLAVLWQGVGYTAEAFMPQADAPPPFEVLPVPELADDIDDPELQDSYGIAFLTNLFGYDSPSRWALYRHFPDSLIATHPDSIQEDLRNPDPVLFYTHPKMETDGLLSFEGVDRKLFPRGTRVTQVQYALTDAHYEYIRAVMAETQWSGGIFDSAPGNVPTNISEGGLGWFAATGTSETVVIAGE